MAPAQLHELQALADSLIRDHGGKAPVVVRINNRLRRRIGQNAPLRRTIDLASWAMADEYRVAETVVHEVAHQLDWDRNRVAGHGPTWKAIMAELGRPVTNRYGTLSAAQVAELDRTRVRATISKAGPFEVRSLYAASTQFRLSRIEARKAARRLSAMYGTADILEGGEIVAHYRNGRKAL